MIMQSIKWLLSTVTVSLCLIVSAHGDQAKDAGTAAGNMVLGQYGNKDAFRQNLAVPMTNAETQMRTVDGSTSFAAAMGIPSSNRFLQLMIQPIGSGDLGTVIVGQDLNSDGTFDHSFTAGPVSGVCANGFIKCTPGTWNNCQPYKWVSDADGKLSVEATGITQLAGCYCINSSCGSTLAWNNSSILLKDLGGGAVGSIHAQDASVMITNVATDITTITYYGQLVRQASTGKDQVPALANTSSVQHQQAYYGNMGAIEGATTTAVTAQSTDPTSMYYQIRNSPAVAGPASVNKCTIQRRGTIKTEPLASFSSTGTGVLCVDHWLWMQIKEVGNGAYELKLLDTSPWDCGSTNCDPATMEGMHKNCGDNPGGDGWHLMQTLQLPPETEMYKAMLTKAQFSLTNISGAGCNSGTLSMDAALTGFNRALRAGSPCPAPGAQHPTFNWSYLFEYTTDSYEEAVQNGCNLYETDPGCRLQDELVDGVVTARGYARTGLNPLPSCRKFSGAIGEMQICREWWDKSRTYVCATDNSFDLSATSRFQTVITSSRDNVNTVTYNDRRLVDGTWTAHNNLSITLPEREQYTECEYACKVRRQKQDTQVGVQGVLSSGRITSDSFDTYYYPCVDNGTTCPTEPGDEILEQCKCANAFTDAAVIMATMRMAGADQVCSSGQKVNPK